MIPNDCPSRYEATRNEQGSKNFYVSQVGSMLRLVPPSRSGCSFVVVGPILTRRVTTERSRRQVFWVMLSTGCELPKQNNQTPPPPNYHKTLLKRGLLCLRNLRIGWVF